MSPTAWGAIVKDESRAGRQASYVGVGVALGAGVGTAFGIATNNIAAGIALGAAIGTALGAALSMRARDDDEDPGD